MFGDNGQVFVLNNHGSHEANGSHGSCAYVQAPPSTLRQGSHGAASVTIAVRSVETPNHICHMLPCLEGGRGERSRLGHRGVFSTCQSDRWDGASTGVHPQKERRPSATNWLWEVSFYVARPTATEVERSRKPLRECQTEKEIKVNDALELVLWTTDTE